MSGHEDHTLEDHLRRARTLIPDPTSGLPDPAFAFALAIVPMVNVDLVVRDAADKVLLAWRKDAYGTGWHVPGGIIRFRESAAARIAAVAAGELGLEVSAEAAPFHVHELGLNGGYVRGHFVSLLYRCRPRSDFRRPELFGDPARPRPGEIAWFADPPANLYPVHGGSYRDAVWG